MLVNVKGVVPGLLNVTFNVLLVPCFTVPNRRLDALTLACGLMTVAVRLTGCGLPGALDIICKVAVCGV